MQSIQTEFSEASPNHEVAYGANAVPYLTIRWSGTEANTISYDLKVQLRDVIDPSRITATPAPKKANPSASP
jgi:alpha-D-ribose 1-methylphosphonate 5-phosphate C-P lyase